MMSLTEVAAMKRGERLLRKKQVSMNRSKLLQELISREDDSSRFLGILNCRIRVRGACSSARKRTELSFESSSEHLGGRDVR